MRLATVPALLHLAVGVAIVAGLKWAQPHEGVPLFILWLVGIPWAVGAVALLLSPRVGWMVSLMTLALGTLALFALSLSTG